MEVKYLALAAICVASSLAIIGLVEAGEFSVCAPSCGTTAVWWNDTVSLTGSGAALSAVTAKLNGQTVCTTTTSASGDWSCGFRAPLSVGAYNLSVTVGSVTDDTVLGVRPAYGSAPTGTNPRYVLETPWAVQEPSGKVGDLVVRLIVWKGSPG